MSTSLDTCLKCRSTKVRYCPDCDCGPGVAVALRTRLHEAEGLLRRAVEYVADAATNDDPSECTAGYLAADIGAWLEPAVLPIGETR